MVYQHAAIAHAKCHQLAVFGSGALDVARLHAHIGGGRRHSGKRQCQSGDNHFHETLQAMPSLSGLSAKTLPMTSVIDMFVRPGWRKSRGSARVPWRVFELGPWLTGF